MEVTKRENNLHFLFYALLVTLLLLEIFFSFDPFLKHQIPLKKNYAHRSGSQIQRQSCSLLSVGLQASGAQTRR